MRRIHLLLLPLLLLAILAASLTSHALADPEGSPDVAIQLGEEEDETEAECAEGDEEGETADGAEEECEVEAEDAGFSPSEDCYLRTARARVVAYPGRETMRLTLGYTAYAPAAATVGT